MRLYLSLLFLCLISLPTKKVIAQSIIALPIQPNAFSQAIKADNTLKMILHYGTGGLDETRVDFNTDATTGFDNLYDANKPGSAPGVPTLYTTMGTNLWYGINTLPSLTDVTTVPMGLRPDMNTTMSLTAEGINTFDPTTFLFLQDKKINIWKDLREGAYSFTTATNDNQARFVLHFTPPAIINAISASCTSLGSIEIQQPGSASWNYSIMDDANQSIHSGTLNVTSPVSISVLPGVYQLLLSDQNGYTVMKNIQVNGPLAPSSSFTADTLIAQVGQQIIFNPAVTGYSSYLWNFGDSNYAQTTDASHPFDTAGVYTVQLTVTDSAGCQSSSSVVVTIVSKQYTALLEEEPSGIKIWSHEKSIFVSLDKPTGITFIQIYNVVGTLIHQVKLPANDFKQEIPINETGYYLVGMIGKDRRFYQKVFINNL
ncbi:MAG: PKD domain-containing protein [Bacteroidetes bacterium]|nr:PKD domain-containing protein [Bacteroidota bacterium]